MKCNRNAINKYLDNCYIAMINYLDYSYTDYFLSYLE